MSRKTDSVREFFGRPERYLHRDYRVMIRARIVKRLLDKVEHARILDLGCGDGGLSRQFLAHGNHVTMVDLSMPMLQKAIDATPPGQRASVRFINSDLHDLATDPHFDIVLCCGLLAHVDSVPGTIGRTAALLKPGGRCVVQITDSDQFLGKLRFQYHRWRDLATSASRYQLNRTTLSQILSIARDHGLGLTTLQRHSLFLPGMGKLRNEQLFRYEEYVLSKPFLAQLGADAMLLFEKKEHV